MYLYVVYIIHQHIDEYSHTIGKIKAQDGDEALERSRLWIARKMKSCRCGSYGNKCIVDARKANTSLKSLGLDIGAEEIPA